MADYCVVYVLDWVGWVFNEWDFSLFSISYSLIIAIGGFEFFFGISVFRLWVILGGRGSGYYYYWC